MKKNYLIPHRWQKIGWFIFIPAVFINSGYQVVGVRFIFVHLCGFKTNFINTHFFGQAFNIFNLVLVWFYHQKLKENKRRFAFQFFFPLHNIFGALQYFFKITTNPVLLVNILRGTINRNDQPVQATLYRFFSHFIS